MKYLAETLTLGEIKDLSGGSLRIYEWARKDTDFTPEQQVRQDDAPNMAHIKAWLGLRQVVVIDAIETATRDVMLGTQKDDLYNRIRTQVLATPIYIYVEIHDNNHHVYQEAHGKPLAGARTPEELPDALENKLPARVGYRADAPSVYLEGYSLEITARFVDDAFIDKRIKKTLREVYPYCIKKDTNIIPGEYLSKGEEGIRQWVKHKQDTSPNNSMEKRMLRDLTKAKKDELCKYLVCTTFKMHDMPTNWSLPQLTVDGRHNSAKMRTLANSLIKDKTDAELLNMDSDALYQLAKDCWVEKLTRAIENIKNAKREGNM